MKRKNISLLGKVCKQRRISPNVFVTATQLRNYMLKDTLSDWLNLYDGSIKVAKNKDYSLSPQAQGFSSFSSFIMNKGCEFEDKIIDKINGIIPVTRIEDAHNEAAVRKVIDLIKKKTPIIANAPLVNDRNYTRGIADLLVRTELLPKLFKCDVPTDDESEYSVIDVKFTTVPILKSTGLLGNSKAFPAYKAQVLIYTNALGIIQNHIPRYGYILGRRYKGLVNSKDPLFTLGTIDYHENDKSYIDRTACAVNWYHNLLKYGQEWSVSPPTRQELLPNMCINNDKWQTRKGEIAKNLDEISQVWQCGVKHHDNASCQNITKWSDPRCNATSLGFSENSSYHRIVNAILRINRSRNVNKVIEPSKILTPIPKREKEFYVDFETISEVLVEGAPRTLLFMIGVGWMEEGAWNFQTFTSKDLTIASEKEILNDFHTFLAENSPSVSFYWHAEENILKQCEFPILNTKWYDKIGRAQV